jgi:small subunit ribosomal protein S6
VSERTYEVLFIVDPTLGEPEVEALTTQVQGYIEKEGGRIEKVEQWGKKRLAYAVKKHREGYYVLIVTKGESHTIREVERRMRVTEGVIRQLAVRIDEDLRKAETRRQKRQKREARNRSRQSTQPQPSESSRVEEADA